MNPKRCADADLLVSPNLTEQNSHNPKPDVNHFTLEKCPVFPLNHTGLASVDAQGRFGCTLASSPNLWLLAGAERVKIWWPLWQSSVKRAVSHFSSAKLI